MSASSADQPMVSRKASHGTPGWKYLRPIQSSRANGVSMTNRRDLKPSCKVSFRRPQAQPMSIQTKRAMPTQKSQTLRPVSHQRRTRATRNSRRPARNGTV